MSRVMANLRELRNLTSKLLLLASLVIDREPASTWAVDQCTGIIADAVNEAFRTSRKRTAEVEERIAAVEKLANAVDKGIEGKTGVRIVEG